MTVSRAACGLVLCGLAVYSCGDDGSKQARGEAGAAGQSDGGSSAATGSTDGGGQAQAGETNEDVGGGAGSGTETVGAGAGGGSGDTGGAGGAADVAGAGGTAGVAGDPAAGAGGDGTCYVGEVASNGTQQNLDLFGTVVYFAEGATLPAGRYRATFVDGCMKYASSQDWTIHAYAGAEPDGWWFVGETTADKIVPPPGTVGYSSANGAFTSFDDCVTANLALPPLEFDFEGGKLGVWLQDSPYSDNLAGQDGRNPKWKLTLLGECVE